MKVLIYGTTNWDNYKQAQKLKPNILQWQSRIEAFVPYWTRLYLTTGTYSPPEHNPTSLEMFQVPFYRPFQYSRQNCYFRIGFVTGIWRALMDWPDFDILIHCQPQRFIGEDLTDILDDFLSSDKQVLAPGYISSQLKGIDVGFIAMKRNAAMMYVAGGLRHSCDVNPDVLNVEEEAYSMFKDSWYNPWPDIQTCKQIDVPHRFMNGQDAVSPYDITSIREFSKLPIIATEKHVTKEFYEEWLKYHPIA